MDVTALLLSRLQFAFTISFTSSSRRSRSALSSGLELLNDPILNKGTAFTADEPCEFGLEGTRRRR
jgi:hypothetical protein